MGLIPPLNDKACLALAMEEVDRLASTPGFLRLVQQFDSTGRFVQYVRSLKQRDDLGDPDDGPRIPCEVSQRLRSNPRDPNCFERAVMYLAAAELLDPTKQRTLASLLLDRGWHTFPVEFRDGRPYVVVLDPISPSHNTMLAAAYRAGNISPVAGSHLVPWFGQMARNACAEDEAESCYDYAIESLRNALITGEPINDVEDLDYVLERAAEDATLWGGPGTAAVREVYRSLRNLSFSLDTGLVKRFIKEVGRTAEKVAPQAIKTALIAKYGPAAALALQGFEVAIGDDVDETPATTESNAKKQHPVGTLNLTLESRDKKEHPVGTLGLTLESSQNAKSREKVKDALRRMTLNFR